MGRMILLCAEFILLVVSAQLTWLRRFTGRVNFEKVKLIADNRIRSTPGVIDDAIPYSLIGFTYST